MQTKEELKKLKQREASKKCRDKNKELYNARQRERQKTPEAKEKHRLKMIEWRKKNPQRTLEISRKNYAVHGKKHNKKKMERYYSEPEFKQKVLDREKRYVESGGRKASNQKPDNMEKARIRSEKRRTNPEKMEHDYKRNAGWREDNKEYLIQFHRKKRTELAPSYVAQSLRLNVKDLTPEVLETQQLIMQLKRELKSNNVKIR